MVWDSDASPADTTIMLGGVVAAGEYFGGEAKEYAQKIYKRIDWNKVVVKINDDLYEYGMGYNPVKNPENPIGGSWGGTSEIFSAYFYDAGNPEKTNSRVKEMYMAMPKRKKSYAGIENVIHTWFGQTFINQFNNANLDFRNKKDEQGIDWHENTKNVYKIMHQFAIDVSGTWKAFGDNSWGVTANYSPKGYMGAHGSEPAVGYDIDGTMTPTGAIASISLVPELSIPALRNYYENYPRLWHNYGFYGGFNLNHTYSEAELPYFNTSNLVLDKGSELTHLENYRTGLLWKYTMKSEYMMNAFDKLGFTPDYEVSNVNKAIIEEEYNKLTFRIENVEEILENQDYEFIYVYDKQGNRIIEPNDMTKGKNWVFTIEGLENDKEYEYTVVRMKNGIRSSPIKIQGTPRDKLKDSDKDGVPDKIEEQEKTNKNDKVSYQDTDNDIVPDYIEKLELTDENDKESYRDSNHNGASDYAEEKQIKSLIVVQYVNTDNIAVREPIYKEEWVGLKSIIKGEELSNKCISSIRIEDSVIPDLKYPITECSIKMNKTGNKVVFVYEKDENQNGIPDNKESYRVTEICSGVDKEGKKYELWEKEILLPYGSNYQKATVEIEGWTYVGYKIDAQEIEKGIPKIEKIEDNHKIELLYDKKVDKEEMKFDLSLDSYISKIEMIENKHIKQRTIGEENIGKVTKVDISENKIDKAEIKISYRIQIKNEGTVVGYATEIKDYIPQGLQFLKEDNPNSEEVEKGIVMIRALEHIKIEPGQMIQTQLVLRWIQNPDNMGIKENVIEISKDFNEKGLKDIDSIPDNKKEEDDLSKSKLLVGIATGDAKKISILLVTIMGIGTINYLKGSYKKH